jgi:asparagine synthase (glutamine-hydrolysing)
VLDSTRDAVAIRQRAAVDVGVLLSGGVDSSLLVGLLREVGVENLSTFSIGFRTPAASAATSSSIPI